MPSPQSDGSAGWSIPTALRRERFVSSTPALAYLAFVTDLSPMAGFSLPAKHEHLGYADYQHTASHPGGARQGAGRAVFFDGHYLKGVGRTALAGNWTLQSDTVHATGHMSASAAARERLVSCYLACKGLGHTIVPCEGVLVRDMDREFALSYAEYMSGLGRPAPPCDQHLQAISIKRDDFARWSNLVWLANQSNARAPDIVRWCRLAHSFSQGWARRKTGGTEGPLTAKKVAQSLAEAAVRSLETLATHVGRGILWNSFHNNTTLDGRFLDLELPTVLGEGMLGHCVAADEPLVADRLPHQGVLMGGEILFEAQQIRASSLAIAQRFAAMALDCECPTTREFLHNLHDEISTQLGVRHISHDRDQQRRLLSRTYRPLAESDAFADQLAERATADFDAEPQPATSPAGYLLELDLPQAEAGIEIGVYLLEGARNPVSERALEERRVFVSALRKIERATTESAFLNALDAGLRSLKRSCRPPKQHVK